MADLIWLAIVVTVVVVASWVIARYEDALIRISHYHGDSVDELIDIAYTARKGKNWQRG